MSTNPREGLPPDLERQLERLERLGNAEAELLRDERGERTSPRRGSIIIDRDSTHRADTDARRRRREQTRARQLGLLLLCLAPLLTLGYALAGYAGRGTLALVLLLIAGIATAAALTILYVARERDGG